ncbi:hypothetical protein ACLB2K_037931 [Fragaria x ananassa]
MPQGHNVYAACVVNGVKFLTERRDQRWKTQNNGIMVVGKDNVAYYGIVVAVIELLYPTEHEDGSVNTATSAYEDDPFVFATTVKQVFYLDDLAKGDAWKIANIVHPRNIYRAATLGVTIPGPEADAYQEPNAVAAKPSLSENPLSASALSLSLSPTPTRTPIRNPDPDPDADPQFKV